MTALANGASRVEAFATPTAARERADALGSSHIVLGGERGSVALPGFDVGNSPHEYGRERVHGRAVLTSTTNGTQALLAARGAELVLVSAFVNLPATVAALASNSRDVTLLCAGQDGEDALEDLACAAAMADALRYVRRDTPWVLLGAERAAAVWAAFGQDAGRACAESPHARALAEAGFAADLAAAARAGAVNGLGLVGADGAVRLARQLPT